MRKAGGGSERATSRAGHEKSCLKMGGPSSKAKYSSSTDGDSIVTGKGEKYSGRRVK